MSFTFFSRTAAVALIVVSLPQVFLADNGGPRPAREVTIPSETKTRLTLQSPINSKLSEVDDIVTATLAEPIYVDGELVLPRGTEFHGRIVNIGPAKRLQRSSHMAINFERVMTPSGAVPISAQVTAIDDWDKEESIKADGRGKMKGGHRGEKTVDNMRKGTSLGLSVGIVALVLGGAAGSSGRQALGIAGVGMAAGMLGGIVLTKGSEIRVAQGSVLRIRFLKAATLQISQQPGTVRESGN
jgi:hypothetical protein